jgi:hypothetical protein
MEDLTVYKQTGLYWTFLQEHMGDIHREETLYSRLSNVSIIVDLKSFCFLFISFYIMKAENTNELNWKYLKWRENKGKCRRNRKQPALWLMPTTLATWKAEIGRIMVQAQPEQNVWKTSISTNKRWYMPIILAKWKV